MKRRTCQDQVAALPGVSHTGHSFHLRHQTGSWAQFFFFSIIVSVQLTNRIIFYQMEKKSFYLLKIHVVSFSSILPTRKDMFKFPRETFKGCRFKCEDKWAPRVYHFCQEEQSGPESKHSCFVCFFFSFEREKKKREEGEREREEGGRKKAGQSMCGVGEKWIKKITKWRVLTLGTQWWYLEQKWPKNGSFYPPFSDENTRLRKLSNSPISNSHTSKIRSQISQFRTWTTFNSTHSAFRCREVCVTYPAYYKGLDI